MLSRALKKPDIFVTIIVVLTISIFLAGFFWKWPLAIPIIAVFRFIRWSCTAIYASVPIFVLGHWLSQKVLRYSSREALMWLVLTDWTMGWAFVVIVGTLLLGLGLYSIWVWIFLALSMNLAFLIWLVTKRWQPAIYFWKDMLPGLREDFVGELADSAKGWNFLTLLILVLAFFHAMIPPNTLDELTYHLVLPRLWEFQHHWWVNTDNYHFLFPANIDIVWGYALAVGGLHLPRLIAFIFGIMTIGGMRRWLKDLRFDPWTRSISIFFFLITPLAMVMLSITYDEWPLLLFIFLGWRTSQQYVKTGNRAYVILTAITWGISLGMKYSVIPVISLLGIEWMLHILRRLSIRQVLAASLILLIGGIVFSGPWFIRNYILTGDPFYPLGQKLPFLQSHTAANSSPHVDYLTRYENLTGIWNWYPWLYHTTVDRTTDHRMHPGWLLLHGTVILFGWKSWRERPWFTVFMLSIIFFYFSPSPRIYFPLMGLTWVFLPYYLKTFYQRKGLRLIISGLMLLVTFPSLSMSLHYWFMTYNRASQDYLIGLINDKAVLRKDGLLTPVMEWVQEETPQDSRIWLWCDYQTFYFDRWVRPSPAYEIPTFLNIVKTYGTGELLNEIKKDNIAYIVINTSNCPLPLKSVKTEKTKWSIPKQLREQLNLWMKHHLKLIVKDHQFELYQVFIPSAN